MPVKKIYLSKHQSWRVEPGYSKICNSEVWYELIQIAEQSNKDWYEVFWMPDNILIARYFSEYIVGKLVVSHVTDQAATSQPLKADLSGIRAYKHGKPI